MKTLAHLALATLFVLTLPVIASAQTLPAIDVFGGYSYLGLNIPASAETTSERLDFQGWDGSAAVGLFHHLSGEADFSGHKLSDCGGTSGLNCSNFSYLFGPRYNLGDRSKKVTGFVHALIGQDRATLGLSGVSTTDTSVGFAGGAAVNYWVGRHIGVQLGPADYFYTHHLNIQGVPGQSSYRLSAGLVLRLGGELPPSEPRAAPSPAPAPAPKSSRKSRRARRESEPAVAVPSQPAGVVNVPGKGLSISSIGAIVAPQEFDGAKVVEVVAGGVAEMASLKAGDLIKSVDGKAVRTPMELAAELSDKSGKVHVGMQRGDFQTETIILLGH
jgi:hypothetical protein